MTLTAIFDLDGTLLDSDAALVGAFLTLGVDRDAITFGHVIAEECARLGLSLDDYVAAYDTGAAMPFPGVEGLLEHLDRWAICSNKHPQSGRDELTRLGWRPQVAMFADAFSGPKRLEPVLAAMDLHPDEVMFVGDTAHDRWCATALGIPFALAGWNPRAGSAPGDIVLATPTDLLDLLGG